MNMYENRCMQMLHIAHQCDASVNLDEARGLGQPALAVQPAALCVFRHISHVNEDVVHHVCASFRCAGHVIPCTSQQHCAEQPVMFVLSER